MLSIVALFITAIVLAVPIREASLEHPASGFPTFPYEQAKDATFQVFWGGEFRGSAFLEKSGYVVTPFHAVDKASGDLSIRTVNGTSVPVSIAKVDKQQDFALLNLIEKLPDVAPLSLADSSTLSIGQPVLLIGSPHGLFPTATAGIVSALNRNGTEAMCPTCTRLIQTDAATGHGSSGGPLLNEEGEVVGMLAHLIVGDSNFNFAVSVEHIRALIDSME